MALGLAGEEFGSFSPLMRRGVRVLQLFWFGGVMPFVPLLASGNGVGGWFDLWLGRSELSSILASMGFPWLSLVLHTHDITATPSFWFLVGWLIPASTARSLGIPPFSTELSVPFRRALGTFGLHLCWVSGWFRGSYTTRSETGKRTKPSALGILFNSPNIPPPSPSDFRWKLSPLHPVNRSQPHGLS